MPDFTTAPIDYSINVATPFQSAMQGYAAGASIRDDQQQQALRVQQQAAQQQQQEVMRNLMTNPNATATDFSNAMLAVPQMREQIKSSWDTRNAAQQQTGLSDTLQWSAAVQAGQPQVAADMINEKADALEKAAGGKTQQSQQLRTQAGMVVAHPALQAGLWRAALSAYPDAEKSAAALASLGGNDRANQLQPALVTKGSADASEATTKAYVAAKTVPDAIQKPALDNANVTSQINERASRLALDRDKLTSETQMQLKEWEGKYGQLPQAVGDKVSEAVTDAIASDQSATRMTDLASRIDKAQADLGSGVTAKTGELWKKTFGGQNDLTRIRSEYNRIVTPAAMSAYKKVASGSTSDKDIDTAMIGVPSDTSDPATMAAFLRGAAKLQVYDSVLNQAKSEWLGSVRNLGQPKSDITVDGVQVPAGTTFKAFTEKYVAAKVADKLQGLHIQSSPYSEFAKAPAAPQPGLTVNDIGPAQGN